MNFGSSVLCRALLLVPLCAQPALTMAQSPESGAAYPSRSVRLVVPFPPGASPNDIIGRLIGRHLADSLGQQVVVDNRAGAGGTIGTDIVAKAGSGDQAGVRFSIRDRGRVPTHGCVIRQEATRHAGARDGGTRANTN